MAQHYSQQGTISVTSPKEFSDLDQLLHEMRLIKSDAEIGIMRAAADISAQAHIHAMQCCQPEQYGERIRSGITTHILKNGARSPAYNSIVGSGHNACILHYGNNNRKMKSGELVLIDAGCELEHYASDITRTFPVNGRFTKEQKAIYQLVLDAQKAAIGVIKEGHRNAPHDASTHVITQGLIKLDLLQEDLTTAISNESYKRFYMHRVGHWLGMDVHDVGDYKTDNQWRTLNAGMVMTVEPGIYIAHNETSVPQEWRGIGVRIEDDVVVTHAGCDILSAKAPKEIHEIEQLMQQATLKKNEIAMASIVIVGGGMVGKTLALLLEQQIKHSTKIGKLHS